MATTTTYDFELIAKEVKLTKKNKDSNGNPIPYNVFMKWGMKENDHTKLLLSFLRFENSNRQLRVLSSFLKRFTKGKGTMIHHKKPHVEEITFSRDYIDGLIVMKDNQNNQYAVIIENKIKDATDGKDQIRGYINHVKNKYTNDLSKIWVLYLTSDGSKTIDPKSYDPEDVNSKTYLGNRFIPLTYREDILAWLKEDILGLRIYPDTLTGVVRAYVECLEDMLVNEGKEYDPQVKKLCNELRVPEIDKINDKLQIERIYHFQKALRKYIKTSNSEAIDDLDQVTRVAVRRLEDRAFRQFEETTITILNEKFRKNLKKKNLEWKVKHYRIFNNKGFIQLRLTDDMGTAHMEWVRMSTSKMLCDNQYRIKFHVEREPNFADSCRAEVDNKRPLSFDFGQELKMSRKETSCVFCYEVNTKKPFANMSDKELGYCLTKIYTEDLGFLFEMLIDKYDDYKDNYSNYNQSNP